MLPILHWHSLRRRPLQRKFVTLLTDADLVNIICTRELSCSTTPQIVNPSFQDGGGSFEGWVVNNTNGEVALFTGGALDGYTPSTGMAAMMSIQYPPPAIPTAFIAQRIPVCPGTVYQPDFNFQYGGVIPAGAAQCNLLMALGAFPGDVNNPLTIPWGSLASKSDVWVYIPHSSSYALPVTDADQTSAYFTIQMDCSSDPTWEQDFPRMLIDSILLYSEA
jgi:hypothetical protein